MMRPKRSLPFFITENYGSNTMCIFSFQGTSRNRELNWIKRAIKGGMPVRKRRWTKVMPVILAAILCVTMLPLSTAATNEQN